jgi:hypothetical protein
MVALISLEKIGHRRGGRSIGLLESASYRWRIVPERAFDVSTHSTQLINPMQFMTIDRASAAGCGSHRLANLRRSPSIISINVIPSMNSWPMLEWKTARSPGDGADDRLLRHGEDERGSRP